MGPVSSARNKPSNERARRVPKGVFALDPDLVMIREVVWGIFRLGFGDPKFRQSVRKNPVWALRRPTAFSLARLFCRQKKCITCTERAEAPKGANPSRGFMNSGSVLRRSFRRNVCPGSFSPLPWRHWLP